MWQIFYGPVIPKNILIMSCFNDNFIENENFQVQILYSLSY